MYNMVSLQGGILDRFSADVGSNDDLLPGLLSDVLTISFMVLGAVTIAITVLPIALILMPPMILVLIRVRRTFVTSSRELKRLEGAARSSMLALLSESLGGIGTIRSNDAGNFFRQRFRNAHDVSVNEIQVQYQCIKYSNVLLLFVRTLTGSWQGLLRICGMLEMVWIPNGHNNVCVHGHSKLYRCRGK
jgi:ABC-type multidrug transport system fused ATPase/permease subunit